MLLVNNLQNLGDLRGSMYDFEKAGDVLSMHTHTDADVHITIVAKGKLKAYSDDWSHEAVAGQLINFNPGEPHELMALEDDTRIFNILKKHEPWTDYTKAEPNEGEPDTPDIKLMALSNVFTRLMHFKKKGDIENGHSHPYDHATMVSKGSVSVEIYDEDGVTHTAKTFTAPTMIYIQKNRKHKLTALEDGTLCACIHALRTVDDNLIDPDFLVEPININGDGKLTQAILERYKQAMMPFAN